MNRPILIFLKIKLPNFVACTPEQTEAAVCCISKQLIELDGYNRMSSLFIQEPVIFVLVILVLSYETTCSSKNPNREAINTSLSHRSHFASEIDSSSRFKRRSQCVRATDECCVKKRFFSNGRVSFECRSMHLDCFDKSLNKSSSSFGHCERVVNRQNVVIDCQCAAGI